MGVITDPIADMFTRIRNALSVGHASVLIPASRTKAAVAQLLKEEGFIRDFETVRGKPQDSLRIHLKYDENRQPMIKGLRRVSKPGLRVYVDRKNIPRVYSGVGIAVLSTSKGLMTGHKAWREKLGGELFCYVW